MKMKLCPICKEEKPLVEFGRNKGRSKYDGLSVYCRVCAREKHYQYRQDNLGQVRAYHRIYNKTYRRTPRGIYYQLKCNATHPVEFTADEFVEWFNIQKLYCYYCQQNLDRRGGANMNALTIDRKDSDQDYALGNITISCRRCNQGKSNVFTEQQMLEIAEKYFKKTKLEKY